MSKEIKDREKEVTKTINSENIEIVKIIPPRIAMRTDVNKTNVKELADSINTLGLICPICVMKSGEQYEVVAGNRRYEACRTLGWKVIPSIILEESSEMYFKTMTAENYERKDVDLFDEVQFIERLKEELNMSQTQIAQYINKSVSYVNERLAVLEYPRIILDALLEEKITFSVAREFNKIDDEQVCETYLKYAIENGCTPIIARKWRKQWELSKKQPERDLLGEAVDNYGEAIQSVIPTMRCAGCQQIFEVTELMSVQMCKPCRIEILKPN